MDPTSGKVKSKYEIDHSSDINAATILFSFDPNGGNPLIYQVFTNYTKQDQWTLHLGKLDLTAKTLHVIPTKHSE